MELGVVIGIFTTAIFTFVGVVFALWYEGQGYPRLEIYPAEPSEGPRGGGAFRAKFIKLKVKNNPKKWPLLMRHTAQRCHGLVTFFTPDNEQMGKPIPIRWDAAPEPIKLEPHEDKLIAIPELSVVGAGRYIDIPPDGGEGLAIAVRIQGDNDAYGWTIDSYLYEWRKPNCKLPSGEYITHVSVRSGDKVTEGEFSFVNPDKYEEFNLMG